MKLRLLTATLLVLRALAPAGPTATELPPPPPAPKAEFSGIYWSYQDGALHTWKFRDDHTFVHTWIAEPAVPNSERGTFHLNSAGDFVLLEVTSPAGKREFRRMRIQFTKDGLLLDHAELKLKYW